MTSLEVVAAVVTVVVLMAGVALTLGEVEGVVVVVVVEVVVVEVVKSLVSVSGGELVKNSSVVFTGVVTGGPWVTSPAKFSSQYLRANTCLSASDSVFFLGLFL